MTGALLCTVEYDVATVDHKATSSHHRQVLPPLSPLTLTHTYIRLLFVSVAYSLALCLCRIHTYTLGHSYLSTFKALYCLLLPFVSFSHPFTPPDLGDIILMSP